MKNLFSKILNLSESSNNQAFEQAILVYIKLSNEHLGTPQDEEIIFTLEDDLRKVIEETGIGEYDGHEFGNGFCVLFIYGPNADDLFKLTYPIIKHYSILKGSYILKRYGPPGAEQEKIELNKRSN